MKDRVEETIIELRISCPDIMLNYLLSQNFKLLGYGRFNHLTNTSNSYKSCHLRMLECLMVKFWGK